MIDSTMPGKPFAIGNTAELHDWQPGWALKLFKDRFTRSAVNYEWLIHRAMQQAGIPVPKVVEVALRFGLLYEKVDGEPMTRILEKHPRRLFTYARKLAELHARMHAAPIQPHGRSTMPAA